MYMQLTNYAMKKTLLLISIGLLLNGCSTSTTMEPLEAEDLQPLTESEEPTLSTQEILDLAYLDELKAEATYAKVMEDFGEVKPFSNIINAEVKHSQSILKLYESYGLAAPQLENYEAPSFESIQAACETGVTAEIANIELYDELMSQTDDQNTLKVFESLQSASQEKHLPAFERCSSAN